MLQNDVTIRLVPFHFQTGIGAPSREFSTHSQALSRVPFLLEYARDVRAQSAECIGKQWTAAAHLQAEHHCRQSQEAAQEEKNSLGIIQSYLHTKDMQRALDHADHQFDQFFVFNPNVADFTWSSRVPDCLQTSVSGR